MRLKEDLELLKKKMGIRADQRKEKELSQSDTDQAGGHLLTVASTQLVV